MINKMSNRITIRLRLLESENSIREMETEVDYLKEQMLLLQLAISEKQRDANRQKQKLEKLESLRRETFE